MAAEITANLEKQCHAIYFLYDALKEQYENLRAQIQLGNKSDFFIQNLQKLHTKLMSNTQDFGTAASKHFAHSGLKTMTDRLATQQKEISKMETEILSYIAKAGQTVAKKIGSEKNAALFKPDRLNHDSTISDWRQWQGTFATYFGKMNMKEENTQDQRSLLSSCLDMQLQRLISNTKHTTIYDDGADKGWLSCLQEYFDSAHPIHMRLLKLMESKPLPGQLSSGFFQEFVSLVEDANASECDVKVLIATIMVSKCPNSTLRRELIRHPLDIEAALRTAREFDASEQGDKSSKNMANTVTQVNTCFRCDRAGHTPENCFTLKSKCPICSLTGHSKKKCRKLKDKNQNKSNSPGPSTQHKKHNANVVEDTNPEVMTTPTVLI